MNCKYCCIEKYVVFLVLILQLTTSVGAFSDIRYLQLCGSKKTTRAFRVADMKAGLATPTLISASVCRVSRRWFKT